METYSEFSAYIDHIGLRTPDVSALKTFYEQALYPLGIRVVLDLNTSVGFGYSVNPFFWIYQSDAETTNLHLAFNAQRREAVRQFYQAALQAGGQDHGAPGIREKYHPNYYAAFIIDPLGNNLEVVCETPEAD